MTSAPEASVPSRIPETPGLAIASLVLGIISLPFSPFLVGGVLGLVGLVLGAIHLGRRPANRALAGWGVGLSLCGILASAGFGALYAQAVKRMRAAVEGAGREPRPTFEEWQGVKAPDLSLTTLEGNTIRLSDLRGKRVVLDFWATWCPPCRREVPHLIQLTQEHGAAGVVVIGISSESKDVLAAFAKEKGINYTIASVPDEQLQDPYGAVRAIPTTFFIDRNGIIQTVFQGYRDYEVLRAAALAEDFQGEVRETSNPD